MTLGVCRSLSYFSSREALQPIPPRFHGAQPRIAHRLEDLWAVVIRGAGQEFSLRDRFDHQDFQHGTARGYVMPGEVKLDDPVAKYLPPTVKVAPSAQRSTTCSSI